MQKIPESIGSKYRFIILAAERAKQLQNNAKPKIKTRSTKPAYIAMKELEADVLSFEILPLVEPKSVTIGTVIVKIALGVTGCIAAYKAIEVMRGLQKAGVSVQVILTRSAAEFVTPLTFESLSAQNVITDMFQPGQNRDIHHISVAQSIQLLAVVPATANILGKFAHGIADDFLSTLYLSNPAPVLIAPAMNVEMWRHPAVRANVEILKARGHHFVDPEPGMLACGMEGEGRLATVDVIVSRILEVLRGGESLAGLKVLVTAGPTVEDIDPIRFISNRSSGKMGYAVAQIAQQRGAEVFLVSGPTSLKPPSGVQFVPVRSAAQMKDAVLALYPEMDIVVKAAAVSDYRPADPAAQKVKKGNACHAASVGANGGYPRAAWKTKEEPGAGWLRGGNGTPDGVGAEEA